MENRAALWLRDHNREEWKVDSIRFENEGIPAEMRDSLRDVWNAVRSRLPDSASLTLAIELHRAGSESLLTTIMWREADGIQRGLKGSSLNCLLETKLLARNIEMRIDWREGRRAGLRMLNPQTGEVTIGVADTNRCESCGGSPATHVTWGLYEQFEKGRPHREAYLCEAHRRELWSKIAGAVAAQTMHFVIRPPHGGKARVQSDGQ